jgi:hypothetical protein
VPPTAIDGSDGPLVTRRIVVWRRLEPGDVRTEGTEIAPESPHLEAKIVEVGIAKARHEEMARLWKKKDEVTAIAASWTTRYEPAGALLAIGGSLVVATLLDMLPLVVMPFAASLVVLAAAAGFATKMRKVARDREAAARWLKTDERVGLEKIEKLLLPRWERFATKMREESGFRTDVRVGDIHEADRLVSIDPALLTHPSTWSADALPNEVRYGWMYRDGRVVEQKAELEDTAAAQRQPEAESEPATASESESESASASESASEPEPEPASESESEIEASGPRAKRVRS